jgi:trehalose 6-phosphate phosphatase
MKYLFSKTGLQLIESLTLTKTLYAFDYDGTLAPIALSPEKAKLSEKTYKLLTKLTSKSPSAIISGRSIFDLKKNLPKIQCHLVGNHGLEGLPSQKTSILQIEKTCSDWKKQIKSLWPKMINDSGVFLEDKTYSLALHYRLSRNKRVAKPSLFELIQKMEPAPRIVLGKSVINLIPAGTPHKGVALLELMVHLKIQCALYIGDDDTDEDVFSLPDERIISIRVGQKRSSNAQFYVKRQSEVNKLLSKLVKD